MRVNIRIACIVVLLFVALVTSERNHQLEEPEIFQEIEHPVVNESSEIDPNPFEPYKVKKPLPPAVGTDCKCGEHTYNDSKIDLKECGERPRGRGRPTALVINGTITDPSQFPWVVALIHRLPNGSAIHFCGGTLISSKLVLTATHCFTRKTIDTTEVWLNEKNLIHTTDKDHPTLKIKAQRLIVHPKYNPIMNYNDILLVELSEAVDIQKTYFRPICLPKDESYDFKDYAYTAGWGQLYYKGPKSNELRHVCLPLLTHDLCINESVSYYKSRVTPFMICAGDIKNGGRDACPGDSGGPLFVENTENNRFYLVGIVSWGEQCALPKRPGVYTRVSKYLSWIHTEALKISDNKICG